MKEYDWTGKKVRDIQLVLFIITVIYMTVIKKGRLLIHLILCQVFIKCLFKHKFIPNLEYLIVLIQINAFDQKAKFKTNYKIWKYVYQLDVKEEQKRQEQVTSTEAAQSVMSSYNNNQTTSLHEEGVSRTFDQQIHHLPLTPLQTPQTHQCK